MFTYTFKMTNGKVYSAIAKDADRARIIAKRNAGSDWTPGAKLTRISNAV